MEKYVLPILLAVIGGGGFAFVQFLITRKDKKNSDNDEVLKAINEISMKMANIEQDQLNVKQNQIRCEMLIMMNHYEEQSFEVLRLAYKYFVELNGDFTMTSIFAKYLEEHSIKKPLWFDENK